MSADRYTVEAVPILDQDAWLKRWTILVVTMGIASSFATGLLILGARYAGNLDFAFLEWNLFLAWVPLGAAMVAEIVERAGRTRLLLVAVLAGWLVVFPNAPYIVTDLVHLQERPPVPLWVDALLLMSFAQAGLLVGFASLAVVQGVIGRWLGRTWGRAAALAVLALSAFGIYLGRFARFNSWDVLTRPRVLIDDITDRALRPLNHGRSTIVVILFTGFLVSSYIGILLVGRFASHSTSIRRTPGDPPVRGPGSGGEEVDQLLHRPHEGGVQVGERVDGGQHTPPSV